MSEPDAHESITVGEPVVADPALAVEDPDHANPHPVDEPLPPVEQMPDAQTAIPDALPPSDAAPGDPQSMLPTGAYVVEG